MVNSIFFFPFPRNKICKASGVQNVAKGTWPFQALKFVRVLAIGEAVRFSNSERTSVVRIFTPSVRIHPAHASFVEQPSRTSLPRICFNESEQEPERALQVAGTACLAHVRLLRTSWLGELAAGICIMRNRINGFRADVDKYIGSNSRCLEPFNRFD